MEFYWISMTALVNKALGSNYKIEEVMVLPSDVLHKILLLTKG